MIVCADVVEWAEGYNGPKFHAAFGDPPYNYEFMGADWDDAVAMHPETWAAIAEHLYPGAFIFAFGGARTYHRLAVALEDAGLRMHPAIGWVNGQGFCKSTRIDTQVDKMAGGQVSTWSDWLKQERQQRGWTREDVADKIGCTEASIRDWEDGRARRRGGNVERIIPSRDYRVKLAELFGYPLESGREVIGRSRNQLAPQWVKSGDAGFGDEWDVTLPATPLAQAWEGHRYGGQVLRPCLELIAVAQKPYEGRPVDDITGSGAGALWIEGGRISGNPETTRFDPATHSHDGWRMNHTGEQTAKTAEGKQGRWPANILLSHVSPVTCSTCSGKGYQTFAEWYAIAKLHGGTLATWRDLTNGAGRLTCPYCEGEGVVGGCQRVGVEKVKGSRIEKPCEYKGEPGPFGNKGDRPARGIGDEDGMETVAKWECVGGCGAKVLGDKAHFFFQADWNHEVTERLDLSNPTFYCPKAARTERDIGLHTLPLQTFSRVNPGGLEHEPRWAPTEVRNPHKTVKPITLARYLATLLLPPDLYSPRRLLVPFAGVASEMIGAYLAGWEEVIGVELLQEHCDIGEMRVEWWRWASEKAGTTDVKEIMKWARKQSKT